MKQIKSLKPYWRDLEAEIKSKNLEFRRLKALQNWLEKNIPDNIYGKYSFDAMGAEYIRVFIYLDKGENNTINAIKWLPALKKRGWIIEKFWREQSGYFAYRVQKNFKWNSYLNYIIFFEETANIDCCVITKKRKMQTIYVTDCENETVTL